MMEESSYCCIKNTVQQACNKLHCINQKESQTKKSTFYIFYSLKTKKKKLLNLNFWLFVERHELCHFISRMRMARTCRIFTSATPWYENKDTVMALMAIDEARHAKKIEKDPTAAFFAEVHLLR